MIRKRDREKRKRGPAQSDVERSRAYRERQKRGKEILGEMIDVPLRKLHPPDLVTITSFQAHICGEEEGGDQLLVGILFYDEDEPIAQTHMSIDGLGSLIDVLTEVQAEYRKRLGETQH